MQVIIGVDGGLSGAIAFLRDGMPAAVEDMPTVPYSRGSITRRAYGPAISEMLTRHTQGASRALCFIEELATGQSGGDRQASAQTIGSQYDTRATLVCVMDLRSVQAIDVSIQKWKRFYGLYGKHPDDEGLTQGQASTRRKRRSLERARDLFPELADNALKLASADGRAEALLIANYARKVMA